MGCMGNTGRSSQTHIWESQWADARNVGFGAYERADSDKVAECACLGRGNVVQQPQNRGKGPKPGQR